MVLIAVSGFHVLIIYNFLCKCNFGNVNSEFQICLKLIYEEKYDENYYCKGGLDIVSLRPQNVSH